jgi:chromosome segregation ATPase
MEQKTKFIIIGLIIFALACLFLFIQATSQQQILVRESNDLKTENAAFAGKVSQLENDLKGNQGKINSLQSERDKAVAELSDWQKKFDSVSKVRDELVEKLKKQQSQRQEVVVSQKLTAEPAVPENTDAYWGTILKAKTDLEMQLASIRVDLRNLQISNESLQREKGVLEIDVNSLRNEKKDLLRQLSYNQKLLDSMSQEVVRERNDKVAIQENFKTIQSENDTLSRQLKSLSSQKIVLDKKIQDLQDGKSTVEKRINEMETMLSDRISQVDSLKDELNTLKSGRPAVVAAAAAPVLEKKPEESVELPAIVVRSSSSGAKVKEEPFAFTGKILAVNTDSNFVVIDLGTSSGVKVGDTFDIYRAGKSIGSIVVIQVRNSISACDIKRMSTPLKIGDTIK